MCSKDIYIEEYFTDLLHIFVVLSDNIHLHPSIFFYTVF